MKLTGDIVKWLEENAYAVKNGEHWFLVDFPNDQIPDKLEVPVKKRLWEQLVRDEGVE
jgi:hypothetical protein